MSMLAGTCLGPNSVRRRQLEAVRRALPVVHPVDYDGRAAPESSSESSSPKGNFTMSHHLIETDRGEGDNTTSGSLSLPSSLQLDLIVQDEDTILELVKYTEGSERNQFALKALRIGILALRQARGEIDAERVRRESDRLLETLQQSLEQHACRINESVAQVLKEYFDPQSGRFQERVERLVRQDGELESVLKRHIGRNDSELAKTLADHFGETSPLMKVLSPDQSQGLLANLQKLVEQQLAAQREQVLKQFSLDNKESALSRFIDELTERQGELTEQLHDRIDEVVKEFSLDDETSALSRLVRNVDHAQRTITREFSLDEESSALSRLKRELVGMLEDQAEKARKFQEEVLSTLKSMSARKKESERSTRHGLVFEQAVCEMVQRTAQGAGDIATPTGNSVGLIRNCKVGDCVWELGPDNAAAGAKIVVEAKENATYDLQKAREEIELARKNRGAQVGLFVFSRKTAPDGLDPIQRIGRDIFVVWDSEDVDSDLYLRVGLILAKALCVRSGRHSTKAKADFEAIDSAILEIEKRTGKLEQINTWAETIKGNAGKIIDEVRKTREAIERQKDVLLQKIEELKHLQDEASEDG